MLGLHTFICPVRFKNSLYPEKYSAFGALPYWAIPRPCSRFSQTHYIMLPQHFTQSLVNLDIRNPQRKVDFYPNEVIRNTKPGGWQTN